MDLEKKESKEESKVRFLEVKWKDYAIGYLMKKYDVGYMFKYNYKGLVEARKEGFKNIPCFSKPNQYYASTTLWEIFRARIPKGSRRDLEEILNRLGVKYVKREDGVIKFDDFDYLACSHGKLMTDFYTLDEVVLGKNKEYNSKFAAILSCNPNNKPTSRDVR